LPSRATLFPYTTLFRSDVAHRRTDRSPRHGTHFERGAVGQHRLEADDDVLDLAVAAAGLATAAARRPAADRRNLDRLRIVAGGEDRKSTRLNSSHVKIS